MIPIHKIYDEATQLRNQGDLEGAVAKLAELLAIDPNHIDTHSALSVYLQKLGRTDEAIAHAIKVCDLQPADPFSWTQLSVIYVRCGKITEAEYAKAKAHEAQTMAKNNCDPQAKGDR